MKRILKHISLILALFITATAAYAQAVVTGTVYEDFGGAKEPMMGVNIAVVNSQNRTLTGTITDMDGNYSIKMPQGNDLTIVFSFIGMSAQRFPFTGQKVLNVTMSEDSQQLKEVVVATERVQRSELGVSAKTFTGSSQSIKMDDVMESLPVTSVEEALQGQLAGVDILAGGDPGAKGSIRIRGTATLNGSADPLIVINGVPYNTDIAEDFDFSTANTEDFADMLSLNPNDIEDIQVLKDAASTALYGTKGANGVLLITTKKGLRGKPKFTFSNKTTFKFEPDPIPMLSGNEYTAYMQDAIWNTANAQGLNRNTILEQLFDQKAYAIGWQPDWSYFDEYNADTDWLGYVRKNAVTTDNNFSMSGGGEKATYRFSLGYLSEGGTTKATDMSRLTSTLNVGYNFSNRLNVVAEFTYSDTKNDQPYFKPETVRTEAMRKMPNKSPYYIDDATGEPTDIYFTYQDANEFQGAASINTSTRTGSNFHPIAAVNESFYNTNTKEEKITIRPRYRILVDENDAPILTFEGYISMKFKTIKTRSYLPQEVTGVDIDSEYNNLSYDGYSNNFSLQSESKLLYNQSFQDQRHSIVAAMIWRTQQTTGSTYATQVYGVATGGMGDPVNGGTIWSSSLNSGKSDVRTLSAIGNLNYTYNRWLSINGTWNYEGTSAIAMDNRWGLFQSYGAALNLQDIEWIHNKTESWLSQAKIRFSWGQSGAAPTGTSPYVGTYQAVSGKYGTITPVAPNSMQLNKLKWQTAEEWDLGTDLAFWNNRIKMTFDYYEKTTKDLLQKSVATASTSAFDKLAFINSGRMRNSGWEYRIDYEIFKNKNWRVTVDFNINRNKNEILELPSNMTEDTYSFKNGEYAKKLVAGTPVGSFFGYHSLGVYQNLEDTYARDAEGNVMRDLEGQPIIMKNGTYRCYPGDAKYDDINHDGKIDENDIIYLGNYNPMVTGGAGVNVKWKDLTLTMRFHYRLGQKIINQARMNNEAMYNTDNQSKAVLRRWTHEGDVTDVPRALYRYGMNYLGSDRFVEDCSYIRLQTITLNYKLPKKWCEKIHSTGITAFVTGYDLFTWTDYKGQDPEVTIPSNVTKIAVDDAKTPRSRRVAVGLTLNF